MSKILVPVLIGAALIGAAVLTGGISLGPSLGALTAGASIGGIAIETTALGASLLVAGGVSILSGLAGALNTPAVSSAQLSRLNPTLVPATPRKIVFGATAMALDTRYIEPSGANQEYFDYIIAVASHAVASIDTIWFEDRIAWTAAAGVDPFYTGYLWVDVHTEGTAANAIAINAGARWSTSCRLTGCAYVHLRIKRTGNSAKASAPLTGGLPGRVTIIGTGAKVYDPRRDTTAGGAGAHRADDQTTWQYADGATVLGTNPALQALWYRLGWRIGGKLAVGKGMPPRRLDLGSYIVAANLCDEGVTLAGGGSQRRYETHGVFSEGDAPTTVLDTICTACAGAETDSSGRLGLEIAHNDLAVPALAFDASDVVSEFAYDPCPSLHQSINVVRGQYTNPSAASLYQLADVPEVRIASPDGIDRPATVALATVEDAARAQRLFKQFLQRAQVAGVFTATFGIRALGVRRGEVVTLTFPPLGFVAKLFRVQSQTIAMGSGQVAMILREEDPVVYAWDRDETPAVVASAPILFDPANNPLAITRGADIGLPNAPAMFSILLANSYTVGLSGNITAVVAGSTAAVTIPGHHRIYADMTVTVSGSTVAGLALSTSYLFYYDDPTRAGGAVAIMATTVAADAYYSVSHPARHNLGYFTTPDASGAGGAGGGSGPPGSGGWSGGGGHTQIP